MAPNSLKDTADSGMELADYDFKPAKYEDEFLDAIQQGTDPQTFARYLDELHALIDKIHGEFLRDTTHGQLGQLGPRVLVVGALGRAVASRFAHKHRRVRVVLAEQQLRDLLPGDLGPTVELMELPPPAGVAKDETLSSDLQFDLVIGACQPLGTKGFDLRAYAKKLKPFIRRRNLQNDTEQNPVQFCSFEMVSKAIAVREELRFAGYTEVTPPVLAKLKKISKMTDFEIILCALNSYEYENNDAIRKDNLLTCRDIFIFFVFLFLFTSAVLIEQSASSSRLAEHVAQKLRGGPIPLESVKTVHRLHDFLEQTFVPALYDNVTDTERANQASTHLLPIDISNRLFGQVRLRQVRVDLDPACQLSPLFSQYTIACYPPYSSGAEKMDRFGPDMVWFHSADDSGQGFDGYMGSYGTGGYMQFLSPNKTLAMETLQELRDETFLSGATRAVFIDFTVWNSNVGSYAVTQIPVEFGASGHVIASLKTTILTERGLAFFLAGFGTSADWLSLIGTFLVLIFVFWYIKEEWSEIKEKKFYYILDPWNVMDWTNMILIFVAFALRISVFADADSIQIGAAELSNRESFTNLSSISFKVELIRQLYALNTVMLWVKCVKYLRHFPVVKVLVQTVWSAFSLFLPFLVLVLVVFIGFIFAYNLGFGDKIWDLATFNRTLIYLARAFLRDVKMMPVYQMTPIFGATLILLFYVGVGLVSINVLAAIVADAVHQSKNSKRPGKREDDDEDEEGEGRGEYNSREDEPLEELQREVMRKVNPVIKQVKFKFKYHLALRAPALFEYFFRPHVKDDASADASDKVVKQVAIVDVRDDGTLKIGQPVRARRPDGKHYAAIVDNIDPKSRTVTVDWDDGDRQNRTLKNDDVQAENAELKPGVACYARKPDGKYYLAYIDSIDAKAGTTSVNWDDKDTGHRVVRRDHVQGLTPTIWWTKDQKGNLNIPNPPPKPVALMHAIEHMSGRVLSEIQEVGIEIRAELHDVCERVAQMHMAVDELGTRIDRVAEQQRELLPRR